MAQDKMMDSQVNPERTGVYIAWVITALGVLLMLWPSLASMDMMGGGFALRFIGLFVTIAGLVTLWFCWPRAAAVGRILSGQDVLAHWTYDPADAQRYARKQYDERRAQNRSLFFLVAALMVVIGGAVLILSILRGEDVVLPLAAFYFGVIVLIGLVAWAAPRLEYRQAQRSAGDAWISREGVYLRGQFHNWKPPFSRLQRVELVSVRGERMLEFDIGQLSRVGWLHYETQIVRVPVPLGQEARAEEIVHQFRE